MIIFLTFQLLPHAAGYLFKITKKKNLFIHWIREEFRVELEQVTGY